jgi:hypothetical protein
MKRAQWNELTANGRLTIDAVRTTAGWEMLAQGSWECTWHPLLPSAALIATAEKIASHPDVEAAISSLGVSNPGEAPSN